MFNFDTSPMRRGTDSYKWDTPSADDIIPMWVADMDFSVAPCITEALRRRVDLGCGTRCFGCHQGFLSTRRQRVGADTGIQLLLLFYSKQ